MPLKLLKKRQGTMVQCAESVGKNILIQMMKTISQSVTLFRAYTNNCVRVTVVTELKEHGFSSDQIASDTGHKSNDSAAVYHRRIRDIEKKNSDDIFLKATSHESVKYYNAI